MHELGSERIPRSVLGRVFSGVRGMGKRSSGFAQMVDGYRWEGGVRRRLKARSG